jgi:hypothetical protein
MPPWAGRYASDRAHCHRWRRVNKTLAEWGAGDRDCFPCCLPGAQCPAGGITVRGQPTLFAAHTAQSRGRFPPLAKVESDITVQCKSYKIGTGIAIINVLKGRVHFSDHQALFTTVLRPPPPSSSSSVTIFTTANEWVTSVSWLL